MVVCSEGKLPDRQIMDFDRCTQFIPAYKVSFAAHTHARTHALLIATSSQQLNILARCRTKMMAGMTLNKMRLELCFNKTAEEEVSRPCCQSFNSSMLLSFQFKNCAQDISDREGQHIPAMSDMDGYHFMSCMKQVARRRVTPVPAQSAQLPSWLTPDRPSASPASYTSSGKRSHVALLTIPVEVDERRPHLKV